MAANAYQILKSEIISGKRKPGDVFDEKQFAAMLGVSRTPVREAVLQLARDGLLVVMPRRGTVISHISMEDVRQLYEARRMLEPQIVRIAAARADKNMLAHWQTIFESQQATDDAAALPYPGETEGQLCRDADAAFHLFLAQCTGNRYIVKQMEELMAQSQRIRNLSNQRRKSRYLASLAEHLRIVTALLQGDGERAAEEVLGHLRNSEEGYHKLMREDAPEQIQLY